MSHSPVLWNPLEIIDQHLGEPINEASITQIAAWKHDKIEALVQHLRSAISEKSSSVSNAACATSAFGQIDGVFHIDASSVTYPESTIRQQLLYFPQILVPDAFGQFLTQAEPHDAMNAHEALFFKGSYQDDRLLLWWLRSLVEIEPSVRNGAVQLYITSELFQQRQSPPNRREALEASEFKERLLAACRAYSADLQSVDSPENAFELTMGPYFDKVAVEDPARYFSQLTDHINLADPDEVLISAQMNERVGRYQAAHQVGSGGEIPWQAGVSMAARGLMMLGIDHLSNNLGAVSDLRAVPVIGSKSAEPVLRLINMDNGKERISGKVKLTNKLLSRFRLPGVSQIPIAEILKLRSNEETFSEFRRQIGDLFVEIDKFSPDNQEQFELEYTQAMQDFIEPELSKIKSRLKGSVFDRVLVPGSLSLTGGAIIFAASGAFPPAALAAAALTPLGLLADKLRKRYSKSGRSDRRIAAAYALLQRTDTIPDSGR